MAIKVGVLQVDLVANTASFTQPLEKASGDAKRSARGIQDSFNGMDLGEARGGLLLVDDLIGVHMPRHAAAFVSQIPGFAQAFSAMFPVVAVAVAIKAILDATEAAKKHREEMEKARGETLATALAIGKHADALHISNLKLQDQIAILQKRPAQNGIAIAMLEARDATSKLVDEFQTAIDKLVELMDKQKQGLWDRLMNGNTGANAIIDKAKEFKSQIDDLTQEMQTAAALGHKKEAEEYRQSLDQKQKDFRAYISTQRDQLAVMKKAGIDTLTTQTSSVSGPNGETQINEAMDLATATKQVNEQYAGTQSLLNDLTILTQGYTRAQREQTQNTGLKRSAVEAQEARKSQDVWDAFNRELFAQYRDTEQKIEHEQDAAVTRGVHSMLQEINEKRKIFDIEQDAAVQHAGDLRQLDEQNLNFARQMGIISEQEYEKSLQQRLAAAYKESREELQLKLNAAKTDSAQQALIQAQLRKLDDKYLADSERAEQASLLRRTSMFRQMLTDWQNIQHGLGQSFIQTIGQMNSSMASFIVTGQGNWRQLAASALEEIVKIGLQWVESKLLMTAAHHSHVIAVMLGNVALAQSSAATAAANTLADAPWPLNIPASLEVFAMGEGFVADAAASRGALLPNREMLVNTHPEEMILPKHISNFIVNAASNSTGQGGSPQSGYSPTYQINAGFATGTEMKEFLADQHQAEMRRQARRRGIKWNP